MFIDTHCHLFKEYYDNIDDIVNKCKENNISKIIVSGTDMKSNKEILELVDKYDIVYGSLGFHPTELDDFNYDNLKWLEDNINHNKIVAVGEIGLDYHYDDTNKVLQFDVLKRQLDIAKKYNKPIIFHSRDSICDTYNILKDYRLKGSIHCFSGSVDMAKKFISLGYMIGVGGVVTYKNSKVLKEVVREIPLSYILLETDAPYLSPEPLRGTINDSSNIAIIAGVIADLKNISIEEVSKATLESSSMVFDFSLK